MKQKAFFLTIIIIVFVTQIRAQKTWIETSGDVLQFALPATALASTFIKKSDDRPHWQFIKTYGLTIGITYTLKYLVNETRPNGGNHSFPSGHTASAFSGAAFIQKRYGWQAGLPAYLLAAYTGYTRVYARKHYVWDVLAGAGIGMGSAFLFTKKLPHQNINISWQPTQNSLMLNFNYRF